MIENLQKCYEELCQYPDIQITCDKAGFDIKVIASIAFPKGDSLMVCTVIPEHVFRENNIFVTIEEDLIKQLGYKYLMRSLEARHNHSIGAKAYKCKELIDSLVEKEELKIGVVNEP